MSAASPTLNGCCSTWNNRTVVTDASAGCGPCSVIIAQTLAVFRAISTINFTNQNTAYLLGDVIAYDFGATKDYYFDPASNAADSPYDVLVPNDRVGTTGRWILN